MIHKTTLAAMLAVAVSACGIDQNPSRDTEDDPEAPEAAVFDRIDNLSDANIVLVHDQEFSPDRPWDLSCQETGPDKIRIKSNGGTLSIQATSEETGKDCELRIRAEPTREVIVQGNGDLDVDATIKDLQRVEVRGNGQITFEGIQSEQLSIEAHGDGEVKVNDLDVQTFDLVVAGRGDTMLSGRVPEGNVQVTGLGDLLATNLQFDNLYIEVRGAGNASVLVTGTIGGFVSGDGNLDVWGEPEGEVEERGGGHVIFHDGPPGEEP